MFDANGATVEHCSFPLYKWWGIIIDACSLTLINVSLFAGDHQIIN
ncbi:hypothetical protein VAA_02558 [Vibrio anguillarum 775]|nr:hypothetical protein VAA_02558 [Vibrio anguillarum 775]ARV26327.1 hypothetical protein A6A12_2463 [Vibrio anguillarum]STY53859.1 Uncharacterised protein [Vibrio anguillarum]